MCDSNTIRRVPAAHLAAEAAQQRPTFTSDALAAIKHQTVLCLRQTSVNANAKTTLIRFASDLSHRLIAIYIEDYINIFNSLLYDSHRKILQ